MSNPITRVSYEDNINQIALLQQYGPLGIQVVRDKFSIRPLLNRFMAYASVAYSRFDRSYAPDVSTILTLAKQKVSEINRAHKAITVDSPYFDLYFQAVKTIDQWNRSYGNLKIEYPGFVAAKEQMEKEDSVTLGFVTKEKFPLAVISKNSSNKFSVFLEWLKSHQKELKELLQQNDSLIFKGFPIASGEEFRQAVTMVLGIEPMDYEGEGSRDVVGNKVYTSTKAPLEYQISLHHELSCTQMPAKYICFYCEIAPMPGSGHTTLAKSVVVTAKMKADKELWQLFAGKNIRYISRHPDKAHWFTKVNPTHKSWQAVCNTSSKDDAEASLAKKPGFTFKWVKGFLEISRIAPAILKDTTTGEDIWYNQAHLYHWNPRGHGGWVNHILASILYCRKHTRQYDVEFEDGSQIPEWAAYRIYDYMLSCMAEPEWQKGNFTIVDNKAALHGKNPSGPRRILATIF